MSRNIFGNVNRTVTKHSFGRSDLKKIDLMSDSALANSKLRELQEADYQAAMEAEEYQFKKEQFKRKAYEPVVEKAMHDDRIFNTIDKETKKVRCNVFKEIVFEMYFNSLVIDSDFCKMHEANLRYVTDKYIDDNGGFALLESAVKETKSPLLKKMKEICESTANSIVRKRLLESKDKSPEQIDFSMTQDEKEKLDFDKNQLDTDEISELVKKKVLTVIQDEKTREESEGKIKEDIENEIVKDLSSDDKGITPTDADGENLDDETKAEKDQKDINESLSRIIVSESPVETGTLFNALLHESYKEILAENIANQDDMGRIIDDDYDTSIGYDINAEYRDEYDKKHSDSFFDEDPVERTEINMDLILSEAISKYTLMELLYTIQLENYTYRNINKLTEKILNDKTPVNKLMESGNKKEHNHFIESRAKFFKHINDLKDLKSVEKNQAAIIRLVSDCDPECKKYFEGHIAVAIKQIEDSLEKNPQFKEQYTGYIEWLENDVTNALNGKEVEPEDKIDEVDDDKLKEFWSNILN